MKKNRCKHVCLIGEIRRNRRAFTLIELLLVMAILGLLISVTMPRYFGIVDRSRDEILKENLHVMRVTIDHFYRDMERYPVTLNELVEKGYLKKIPQDPVTGRDDTWVGRMSQKEEEVGVVDVQSGAEGASKMGKPYRDL